MKELLKDEALQAQAAQALKSMQQAAQDVKKTQQQIKSHKKAEKKLSKTKKKAEQIVQEVAAEPTPKAKKKRHPIRKLVVLGTIGAVVALVVSEDARKVVLDLLFGAEEEFEYTSNVSAASGSSNGAS